MNRRRPPATTRSKGWLAAGGLLLGLLLSAALELALALAGIGEVQELHEFPSADGPVLTRHTNWPALLTDPDVVLDHVACTRTKPPGTRRIVVVGESTAAGFPFSPQFSFSRVLQARLHADLPDLPLEVVNFGRSSDPSAAVVRTALESLAVAPDVIVVCSGHNDYQSSYTEELRDGLWNQTRAWLRRLHIGMLLARIPLPRSKPEATGPDHRPGEIVGDRSWLTPSELARGQQRLHRHLDTIVQAARRAGCEVVLMTQVANLASFPPCFSWHSRSLTRAELQDYEVKLRELLKQVELDPASAQAEALARELAAMDPDVALLRYLAGVRLEKRHEPAAARAEFIRALELDGYPNRAGPRLNEEIRAVARETGASLADAEARFFDRSSRAAPGDDLFLDHCHPTLEGTFVLADAMLPELLAALQRRGLTVSRCDPNRPTLALAGVDEWLAGMALTRARLAKAPADAGRVNLLLYFQSPGSGDALVLARRAFEESLRVVAGEPSALVGLLVVEIMERHREAALDLQSRVLAIDPKVLRPVDELSRTIKPLQQALLDLGLEFTDGRLEPRVTPPPDPPPKKGDSRGRRQ